VLHRHDIPKIKHSKSRALVAAIALALAVPVCSAGNQTQNVPPAELVRRAVQNETAANTGPGVHFMFKDRRQTTHLTQTKLIVETRDSTAGMVIEQDGRPLTPQQLRDEAARLENYVRNPEAFLYELDGTEKGSGTVGRAGEDLLRLKFSPNPNYTPPTRVEQVLTGMAGHLLIDTKENRVAEIDGTLQKDVGFGWGILGHLDRGGRFLVQQADVGDHHWEVTHMELSFTGKILFFKKLNIRSSDFFSEFHVVPPDLTFAQGVDLLKKQAASEQATVAPAGV
jgi:hypothetical protein